jgi:hypothetical protein
LHTLWYNRILMSKINKSKQNLTLWPHSTLCRTKESATEEMHLGKFTSFITGHYDRPSPLTLCCGFHAFRWSWRNQGLRRITNRLVLSATCLFITLFFTLWQFDIQERCSKEKYTNFSSTRKRLNLTNFKCPAKSKKLKQIQFNKQLPMNTQIFSNFEQKNKKIEKT